MQTVTSPKETIQRKGPMGPKNLTSFIRRSLDLSTESLGRMLQVSSRTITRWEEEKHSPKNQTQVSRIHKLKEIIDLGSQIYTPEGLREFLSIPQPVFGGRTAYQLMSIDEYDAIVSALVADYEGPGF